MSSATPAPKPRLRGWLHAVMTPLALVMGIVLIALAPTVPGRIGGAVWLVAAVALFGTSATYHRGTWKPRSQAMLRRADHANIFIFIAASYTPLALMLLSPESATTLLWVIWIVAALGTASQLLWIGAPRWIHVILYLAMGWAAVGWVGGRPDLHPGRGRLRPQAPQPLAGLVRLPRDFPPVHHRRGDRPLHRDPDRHPGVRSPSGRLGSSRSRP